MPPNEHLHHPKHSFWLLGGLFLCFCLLYIIKLPTLLQKNRLAFEKEARCQTQDAAYRNAQFSTEERVEDLLARMTEREKIGQLALVEKKRTREARRCA